MIKFWKKQKTTSVDRGEDILCQLEKKNGELFACADSEIVQNWYRARDYVLCKKNPLDVLYKEKVQQEKLKNETEGIQEIKREGIYVEDKTNLHVVIEGCSDLMLSVARQIALVAHFPNFDDSKPDINRTVISILFEKENANLDSLIARLKSEEMLGNLLLLAKHSALELVKDGDNFRMKELWTKHENSYIDIAINLVAVGSFNDYKPTLTDIVITESDVIETTEGACPNYIQEMVINRAKLINTVYSIGEVIDNLSNDDPYTAEKYDIAINVYHFNSGIRNKSEKDWKEMTVRNKLSNVFCADCIEYRLRSAKVDFENNKFDKNFFKASKKGFVENLKAFSKCEHSRWCVEKLILGFRPLSEEEIYTDNSLLHSAKSGFRSSLKKNSKDPSHIDLCSYRRLRTVNPGNAKFDTFLVLATPYVIWRANNMNK